MASAITVTAGGEKSTSPSMMKVDEVRKKFVRHQFYLVLIGTATLVLSLLYTFEVFPMNWSAVLVNGAIQVVSGIGNVVIFLKQRQRKTTANSSG